MMTPFAVWRVLACPVAVPKGMRATDRGTTEGGLDKRPRAKGLYRPVVVEVFARRENRHSAAPVSYRLISRTFRRAALFSERPIA